MSEQNKRFVLYEYLLYFWKKKIWFIIIPIITALLIAGAVYVLKSDKQYIGQSQVYVGSINSPELTHPNNIMAMFPDLQNEIDVYVAEKGQVKLTVKGDSKKDVQEELDIITSGYMDGLEDNYNERYELTTVQKETLEDRIAVLDESIKNFEAQLEEHSLEAQFEETVKFRMFSDEYERTQAQDRVNRMNNDLALFEKPETLWEKTSESKSYLPESIIAGLFLGLVLALGLLILLKYIEDARRYYHHD